MYVNGRLDAEQFDGKLEFDVKIIPYEGDDSWVEGALMDAKKVLDSEKLPQANPECDFCSYRKATQDVLSDFGASQTE
mgnify:CR=1 FL=1